MTEDRTVAKKKAEPAKQPVTMIRVFKDFADEINRVASFERMSIAEFAEAYLRPVIARHYRDAVARESKRLEGK